MSSEGWTERPIEELAADVDKAAEKGNKVAKKIQKQMRREQKRGNR